MRETAITYRPIGVIRSEHVAAQQTPIQPANASDIVDKLKFIGESKNGIFMLDRLLGERKAESE